ncbi:helix-turn-helix domain-containing protein [Syntrophomonas curvata]
MFNKDILRFRLRTIRKNKNLTLQNVADAVGSTKSTISNIERGAKPASFDLVIALANYYEVSIDYLLGATDFPYPLSEKVLNIINQSRDPDELLAIIKEITQSEKSGQAAEQPGRSKIDRLLEGLDEESMVELRKYIAFLRIRQTLDGGGDENSAGLDGDAGNKK